jgi:phage terminase small subunit
MPGNSNSGGRNAKDVNVLKASGTYRPDRHAGVETPDPPKGRPEPPKQLSDEEAAEWNRMVDRLENSKTLAIVDDGVLYQYVQLFAETELIKADNISLRKLAEQLRRLTRKLNGTELVESIRKIVDLQYLIAKQSTQLRQGHMALRQYLVEFGQTPSSRTRVKITKEPERKSKLLSFNGGKAAAAKTE